MPTENPRHEKTGKPRACCMMAPRATAVKFRRYMLVRTLMSVITGVLVWAFAALAGLDLAVEWGVIAFALNYIPFIGPFIATMFPTLFALAQFESWQTALLVFACLNLIQFVVGSYVEPRVAGAARSRSRRSSCCLRCSSGLHVGPFRRLHRRPDHDCATDLLRAACVEPLACRPLGAPSKEPAAVSKS